MKICIIAEARIKTDATDSEALAHLLRANLLHTAYSPFAKRRTSLLKKLGIGAVDNCLCMIGALDERIREVSNELKEKLPRVMVLIC